MQLFKVIINEDDEGTLTHGRRHCFQEGLCCVISRESFSSLSKSKHKEEETEGEALYISLFISKPSETNSVSGGLLVQVFPIRGKEIGAGVGINDGSPSLNRENSNSRIEQATETLYASRKLLDRLKAIDSSYSNSTIINLSHVSHVTLYGQPIHAHCFHLDNVVLRPIVYQQEVISDAKEEYLKQILLEEIQIVARGTQFAITNYESTSKLRYSVVDCFPYHQGIMTPDTTVIIIDPPIVEQPLVERESLTLSPVIQNAKKSSLTSNGTSGILGSRNSKFEPLVMPAALLPQLKFDNKNVSSPPASPRSAPTLPAPTTDHKVSLTAQLLPVELWSQYLPFESHPDDSLRIGVSLDTLRKLQVFNGDWVYLRSPSTHHIGQIFALDHLPRKHCAKRHSMIQVAPTNVYLSSQMIFNMQLEIGKSTITLEHKNFEIPTASQLTITRVKSPESDGHTSYAKFLKQYFQIPRLVKQGDLFGIPIVKPNSILPDYENEFSDDEDSEQPSTEILSPTTPQKSALQDFIYFKITKAVPPTSRQNTISPEEENARPPILWIDKKITTLLQEGAVNSRIPPHTHLQTSVPPGISEPFLSFVSLLEPCLHPMSASLGIKSPTILLRGPRGCGKSRIVKEAAKKFGIHLFEINCYEILGQIESQTESELRKIFKQTAGYSSCILILRHLHALEKSAQHQLQQEPRSIISNTVRECISTFVEGNPLKNTLPVFIVATTSEIDQVSGPLRGCFRHEIVIESPGEKERNAFLSQILSSIPISPNVSVRELAILTASLTRFDMYTMVTQAGMHALERIYKKVSLLGNKSEFNSISAIAREICSIGFDAVWGDFERAISSLKSQQSSTLGAPKIPKVMWEDVGGLIHAKKEILDTIQLPLQHPSLFADGVRRRSGVLLYGPPGTGKTLLAKAVATECSLNFLSVKGPELINMYVGESEKNVRDLFQKARAARPCVIFFDELDSLAPNRGKGADSGGVMDRIVSQLLAELDGMQKSGDLFVIGATNRPDLIDPALLRPGRFDCLIYLGVSEDHESQLKIVKALTRKFNLSPSLSLERVVEQCPLNLTGADFYALCSDALLNAISEHIERLEAAKKTMKEQDKEFEEMKSRPIQVEETHFLYALKRLTPSVSEQELRHYKQLQASYQTKKK